jgi:hypothetical protein
MHSNWDTPKHRIPAEPSFPASALPLRETSYAPRVCNGCLGLHKEDIKDPIGSDLSPQNLSSATAHTLLSRRRDRPKEANLRKLSLEPFEVYVAEISE